MYSIRPHSSQTIELDLPTTMYSVQPVIQQSKVNQILHSSLKKANHVQFFILAINECISIKRY
jgi:hypothetical protein